MPSKKQIAKEFERLTFMKMQGVQERPLKELQNVLRWVKQQKKGGF